MITPDGALHEGEWESLPKEVCCAGVCGDPAADADFYRLSNGRVVGFNTPYRVARMLGLTVEQLVESPGVKLGTDVDDGKWAEICKTRAIRAMGCRDGG